MISSRRRATIVGTGLIGGSVGMALRRLGWTVTGVDSDEARAARAVELGALDAVGRDPNADLVVIATPVKAVAAEARRALAETSGLVTDVGSVKAPIVAAVDDPRFIAGHPMAGSEHEGIEGADPNLFEGATWVLTPTPSTDSSTYAQVRGVISQLGAEIVSLAPDRHDALVAVVSHVPHLTAASLMTVADERAEEHRALLRLAAGGFRDMTRIASGHPGIWPDICSDNRDAILTVLDRLLVGLTEMREVVASGDRQRLTERLEQARRARLNLPARFGRPGGLTEVLVPVPDEKGVLADVTTLATDLDINILDFEISHSAEGPRGTLHLLVESNRSEELIGGLTRRGYKPSMRSLV